MISLPAELLAAGGFAMLAVGGVVGGFGGLLYKRHKDAPAEFEAELDKNIAGEGHTVTLPSPETSGSLMSLLSISRHKSKEKKLASRGYVKWYKLDGMLSPPKWVKPERSGSGEPKYYDSDDDVHYLFPQEPLVTDAQTGAPVAVHHSGEVEPVNIANPAYPPIDADRLEEVINLEIDSEPPSWFSKFDIDATTMMWLLIIIVMGAAAAQQFL
jgi:hypothetical protein